MTLRVVFRRVARAEFDAAAVWYEERQSRLCAAFAAEINRAVELVSGNPERFPKKHGAIRCVRARRFPYSIYFLLESHRVVVLAIFHARRDPRVRQARP